MVLLSRVRLVAHCGLLALEQTDVRHEGFALLLMVDIFHKLLIMYGQSTHNLFDSMWLNGRHPLPYPDLWWWQVTYRIVVVACSLGAK